MRIIAGELRGRRLLAPDGPATRPITDRAKQSLFDIVGDLLPDVVVYDCFAGTGSMGLEALSRGARLAIFFESDRSALTRLRQNIESLGVGERSRVVSGDLFRWLAEHEAATTERAGVVFLDPPYRFLRERPGDLRQLAQRLAVAHLMSQAVVVFRHHAGDSLNLPGFRALDQREYGDMAIQLLARA
jgi:16S rRNA (guanine966-N2)-methyltransferase